MQLLDPLAVEDVGLFARHILDVTGVDQIDLKAPRFQDVVAGNPVDPRRLHGHGVHTAGFQPIGQGVQVTGEGLEHPDRDFIAAFGHSDIDLVVADVQSSRVEVDLLQGFQLGHFQLVGLSLSSCGFWTLKNLLSCGIVIVTFRPGEASVSVAS